MFPIVVRSFVSKGEVGPRDTKEKAARSLKMALRSQSCRGITVSLELGIESVQQRGDSPVLVMHDGVRVDFPSCEKVADMILEDLDTLRQCAFHSCFTQLVKLCKKRLPKATRNPTVLHKVQ